MNGKNNNNGERFYRIITILGDTKIFLGKYMYDGKKEAALKLYFENVSPKDFLIHLDSTEVNGDSSFQINLVEVDSNIIIKL